MIKQEKIAVQTLPKVAVQLNRKMIISVAAAVTAIVLFGIIGAFSVGKKPVVDTDASTSTSAASRGGLSRQVTIDPEIIDLPSSYTDIAKIKKFSQINENDQRFEDVLRQLEELQGEYRSLKEQYDSKGEQPEKKVDDEQTRIAKSSELVFKGLGSDVENMFGDSSDRSRSRFGAANKDEDVPMTPAQENLIKTKEENKRRAAVAKGRDEASEIYDMHGVIKPISKYQLQAGTLIPATLISGINTSLVGTIIAQVKSDIYDTVTGKYLLIPKGSKLLGEYESQIRSGQRRILMFYTRIVRPDGSSILLSRALGVDALGQSGVEGDVNNHWARILGAATISTILTVGAGIGTDSISNSNNYQQNSMQRAGTSAGAAISDVGRNITNRSLDIQPTITVPPGYQFNVAVRKDMVLDPYKRKR